MILLAEQCLNIIEDACPDFLGKPIWILIPLMQQQFVTLIEPTEAIEVLHNYLQILLQYEQSQQLSLDLMDIRFQLLQIVKDLKANMFLSSAVKRLLDEVRLIKSLATFLHVSLQQLHAFFISDLQTLLAQHCPKGKVIVDPLKLDAEHCLNK